MKKQNLLNSTEWLFFSFCGFLLAVFLFLPPLLPGGEEEEPAAVNPADMSVHVKTAVVKTGGLPVSLKATGMYVARSQSPALVVSRIPGIVSSVEVQEGQQVEAGTILIHLDTRLAKIALTKAKAGLRAAEIDLQKAKSGGLDMAQSDLDVAVKEAEVTLQLAKQESARQSELLKDRLASAKAAEDARLAMENAERKAKSAIDKASNFRSIGREAELARLQSALDLAKAEEESAEYALDASIIKAPGSGRVTGLKVNSGGMVDDKTALVQIIGERNGVLRTWIAPPNIEEVTIHSPVTVQNPTAKKSIPGTVISIGGELDPETGMIAVEIQLDSEEAIQPRIGEILYADIITQESVKGFLVPNSAITIEDDKAEVFTVDSKQTAHAVPVEILTRSAEISAIASEEISDGSTIITDGNYNLPDGAHVVEDVTK